MLRIIVLAFIFIIQLSVADAKEEKKRFKYPYDLKSDLLDYEVANIYPHSPDIFTQGLFLNSKGQLWESSGNYGKSALILRSLDTAEVIYYTRVPDKYFAEGITELNSRLYMLTWRSGVVFEFDLSAMEIQTTEQLQLQPKEHKLKGFGWGLTTNGKDLIISDGSNKLRIVDPQTFEQKRIIYASLAGRPVYQLNELEWVEGYILANVYQTDLVVAIEPEEGRIKWRLDLSNLRDELRKKLPELNEIKNKPGVLNGIAYNSQTKTLLVTGKYWPLLFELKVSFPSLQEPQPQVEK